MTSSATHSQNQFGQTRTQGVSPVLALPQLRWNTAIAFRGEDFRTFGKHYFSKLDRRILIVAGAGFDPRTPRVSEQLAEWAGDRVSAFVVREERLVSDPRLRELADRHVNRIRSAISIVTEVPLTVFDESDLAVVGGRHAAALIRNLSLDAITDVVVDLSALSVGTSFPLVRALIEQTTVSGINLHAIVVADAALDATIVPEPAEIATEVHGFRGEYGLDHRSGSAKLWLPLLAAGRRELLDKVHVQLEPHDTCPILPFPAHDPRVGDTLIEEYLSLITDSWDVDPRNIIYAAEDDPLDVYRTILELDDARQPVFADDGGSLCVLSPVGSKVLGLGALMAATERDFPVLHVEAVGFKADVPALSAYPDSRGTFAHVWLTGDPYRKVQHESESNPASLKPSLTSTQ